jgi:hypothetical protein
LLARVTRARNVAATIEPAHVAAVPTTETSAQEAVVVSDSITLHVKDAEGWPTLVERVAQERVMSVEAENAMALASTHDDAEGLIRKITLLEGKLADERQAREVAKENSRGLSEEAADAERQWEVSEKEHREQFDELTLLQTWGFELCHAIAGPTWVSNHLSEGMWLTALHHTWSLTQ